MLADAVRAEFRAPAPPLAGAALAAAERRAALTYEARVFTLAALSTSRC
jgi:hypothetical protein